MQDFALRYTGDMCDADGSPTSDLGWDLLDGSPHIHRGFLSDQQPRRDDPSYHDRLYSLQVESHHVESCNGIVVCRPWVKASAFARGAGVLIGIGRAGIGYDKIDLAACTANDVVVFNSPYGLTHTTASAALFLILGLSRRFYLQERIVREYRWDLQNEALGDDLSGRTLGIIGLGKTGLELARLVAPFDMRIIAYSPHADPRAASALGVTLVGSLDQVLRDSDYRESALPAYRAHARHARRARAESHEADELYGERGTRRADR